MSLPISRGRVGCAGLNRVGEAALYRFTAVLRDDVERRRQ
jgi:hypothetical protein